MTFSFFPATAKKPRDAKKLKVMFLPAERP
jgi:hypothetical protein